MGREMSRCRNLIRMISDCYKGPVGHPDGAKTAAQRSVRLLQRHGLLDNSLVDELSESEPLQAALSARETLTAVG